MPSISSWIDTQLSQAHARTSSLIVTIFGDSVEPHGGVVWLGSLTGLLSSFGINERSTRTSVFRLVRDQWLESEGMGRRSFYRLSASGRLRAAHAHRRIYEAKTPPWDGSWILVVVHDAVSASLRHDLEWEGFGQLAPKLFAHPAPDLRALEEVLKEYQSSIRLTTFRSHALGHPGAEDLKQLARRSWSLDELSARYEVFISRHRPLRTLLARKMAPTPEQCFIVRTLLIHEFRRAQLRDPQLPPALLPGRWLGAQARELCRELYVLTTQGAEQHLVQTAQNQDGALRPPAPYFFERFGGLAGRLPR